MCRLDSGSGSAQLSSQILQDKKVLKEKRKENFQMEFNY